MPFQDWLKALWALQIIKQIIEVLLRYLVEDLVIIFVSYIQILL